MVVVVVINFVEVVVLVLSFEEVVVLVAVVVFCSSHSSGRR